MYIIGQESNLDIINSWSKLPNFIIIQGDEHVGKSYLVLYLCNKFNLFYRKIDVSVKSVRSLIDVMVPNSNTIYHLKNFDKASLQAKNALLKITEECIEGNYIVITGGPQIKTLESRARRLIMQPYTYDQLTDYINKYIPNISDTKLLYDVGINTPAKISYYKDCENLDNVLQLAIKTVNRITYITPRDIIETISKFDDKYEEIDECLLFLNMLIHLLESNLKQDMYTSYINILEIIISSKNTLLREKTLRRKMLLFNMFYEIGLLQKEQL